MEERKKKHTVHIMSAAADGASLWQRIRGDLETKQQIVTVGLVALFVIVFETIFFYRIVVPRVDDAMQWMLKSEEPDDLDPDVRRVVNATLEFTDRQERAILRDANGATQLTAVLIAALPALIVIGMYAGSAQLRRSRKRPIVYDTVIIVAGIIGFQIFFYLFTQGWRYPGTDRMAVAVCEDYNAAAARGGVPNVATAADAVAAGIGGSTLLRRLTERYGGGDAAARMLETALLARLPPESPAAALLRLSAADPAAAAAAAGLPASVRAAAPVIPRS